MKQYFTSLLLLVLLISISSDSMAQIDTDEAASRYNEANELYRNDQYVAALEIYENLIARGYDDSQLYYNAANAAFRNNSLGTAILYLEKARKLDPSDADITANLEFLNSLKTDEDTANDNAVLEFMIKVYDGFNSNEAAIWSGILFFLALMFLSVAFFVSGWNRNTVLSIGAVTLLLSFISTGMLIEKLQRENTVVEAVLLADEALAFSGPGDDNTHIFTIHEGTKVTIERSQGEWSLIRLKSGSGGWIKSDSISVI